MKITSADLLSLRTSLQSLDNFKFDAKTTYTLSRNLNWVESEIVPLENTRKKILADSGSPNQGTEEWDKFVLEWEKFLQEPVEIKDLRLISYSDLNIGKEANENAISVRIVNGLFPILKEEEV